MAMHSGRDEPPNELQFSFAEMLREIKEFSHIALSGDFLAPGAERVLDQFYGHLEQIRRSAPLQGSLGGRPGSIYKWAIFDEDAIITRPSTNYERGRRSGGVEISAKVTAIWQIRPAPRAKKSKESESFHVAGKASVKVEWHETLEQQLIEPLGMWRMELADGASPGCYFHAQIQGEDGRKERPFPHSVPVPRLPCIAFTPMAVLEFVLGELFQDLWEGHTRANTSSVETWRGIQRSRLERLLGWQQQMIRDNSAPPWTALKSARPHVGLFCE
ncbi:hypothetical protein [Paludisphaera rhizosphaerae]|uniref:hypothetical protein n=1 Tax=Paludisphaera rhizosphaerae TaxID=2711216 RepID=UPI0013EBBABF|nr:hypothetical protein [Paludisphaera rhizosphaerae]